MKKHILHVIEYFAIFDYPPTFAEIHLFLQVQTTEKYLHEELGNLLKKRIIYSSHERYALNKGIFKGYQARNAHSITEFKQAQHLLSQFGMIPLIQLIGISGSLSMLNSKRSDDIDLFVVVEDNAVWTSRFVILSIKKIAGIFNNNYRNLCLNLIFSKSQLTVPQMKQNEYVAHEVLQLKPIFVKREIHLQFLQNNKWIVQFFPQSKRLIEQPKVREGAKVSKILTFVIEPFLRAVQVWWLAKKKINFQEHNGQLWLIQNDVQKKVEKRVELSSN